MALSEAVQGRLYNWKFLQAVEALENDPGDPTEKERALVKALGMFGNPGWFMGGDMELIIEAALSTMLEFEEA